MIRPKDVFTEAYGALTQNRRRSIVTMLGMAWGIATVVLLLAYGTGFSTAIIKYLQGDCEHAGDGLCGRAYVHASRR